jgi:hypothetical protein
MAPRRLHRVVRLTIQCPGIIRIRCGDKFSTTYSQHPRSYIRRTRYRNFGANRTLYERMTFECSAHQFRARPRASNALLFSATLSRRQMWTRTNLPSDILNHRIHIWVRQAAASFFRHPSECFYRRLGRTSWYCHNSWPQPDKQPRVGVRCTLRHTPFE